jgi:hypothetical protein
MVLYAAPTQQRVNPVHLGVLGSLQVRYRHRRAAWIAHCEIIYLSGGSFRNTSAWP